MFKYIDANTSYNAYGVTVTNEEPIQWDSLIHGHPIRKAGAVCSGGEVPILILLPRCQEVIAIDHGYKAIAHAMTKALILNKVGPVKFRKILLENDLKRWEKEVVEVDQHLPADLKASMGNVAFSGSLPAAQFKSPYHDFVRIRQEWGLFSLSTLKRVIERLDRITFVHGDVTDLAPFGELDALYLSNCFGHSGRLGAPKMSNVLPLVKTGGLLMEACHSTYSTPIGVKQVEFARNYRSSWIQVVWEKQ